jgi:hypothetical protein
VDAIAELLTALVQERKSMRGPMMADPVMIVAGLLNARSAGPSAAGDTDNNC